MLFRSLHGVMKPGAVLEAQCGGEGNIAEVERALDALSGDERFAPYLRGDTRGMNFASVEDTRIAAERGGLLRPPGLDAPAPGHADGSRGATFQP